MSNTNSFLLHLSFIPGLVPVEINCTEGVLRSWLRDFDARWTTRSEIAFVFAGVVHHSQTLMDGPFLLCNASFSEAIDRLVARCVAEPVQHIVWALRMEDRIDASETVLHRERRGVPRTALTREYLDALIIKNNEAIDSKLQILIDLCNVFEVRFDFNKAVNTAVLQAQELAQASAERLATRKGVQLKTIRVKKDLK